MKKPYNTMADLKVMIERVEKLGYNLEEIPVLIGDDDELNGVHTSWHEQELLDREGLEDLEKGYTSVSIPRTLEKGKKTDMFYLLS